MNSSDIITVKFGGSSLADAAQFRKVEAIIKSDSRRRYVIPSAPGKRDKNDQKITDMLYACAKAAAAGSDFSDIFSQITARYNGIINELGLKLDLSTNYEAIKTGIIAAKSPDFAASRGEYVNGIILAALLGFEFVDAAEIICFDEKGRFNADRTNELTSARLREIDYAVIPGFYGSNPDGSIRTFSRGGSDISGAIVSQAVNADIYENWTDVSGFLVADPRIVENPDVIDIITYKELRELSYMGATVLHEDAIFPVSKAKIPINIKNTNCPSDPGTMIVAGADGVKNKNIITGISGKKDFTVFLLEKQMMNGEIGFGRKLLEVFERNGVSFEHMPSGIDTLSLVVSNSQLDGKTESIVREIYEVCEPDSIELVPNLALIATVGTGMVKQTGTAARLFAALGRAGINVRMIDQGSSELNIIVGVDNSEFDNAIKAIYAEFYVKG